MRGVGFVLAGGQSRRMGQDKALMRWEGASLLDHAITRLRAATAEVRILCGSEPRYADRGVPVDVDGVAGAGALGGVLTGLAHLRETRTPGPGLFLAVDLPHVPVALLAHLLTLAESFDAVVPVSDGGPEPLCAAYNVACFEPIRERLARRECKMTSFWPDVRVGQLKGDALLAFGDPRTLFRNLNTPED
jgi:molybdopterin-guanine dinucleotide biosynthesis protein A